VCHSIVLKRYCSNQSILSHYSSRTKSDRLLELLLIPARHLLLIYWNRLSVTCALSARVNCVVNCRIRNNDCHSSSLIIGGGRRKSPNLTVTTGKGMHIPRLKLTIYLWVGAVAEVEPQAAMVNSVATMRNSKSIR
jgi:hypothetical protein